MVLFDALKPLITSACRISNYDSNNIKDRYQFSINMEQLEEIINKADPTFHILAVDNKEVSPEKDEHSILHSKTMTNSDITNIMEYIHKPKEVDSFIHDNVNYIEFMIYCTDIKNEELKKEVVDNITTEDGSTKPIWCPYRNDGLNDLVSKVVSYFPVYKVLVMRKFNFKKDKFIYSILFRSNYEMIEYVNNNFSKKKDKEE
jgi:hypothetical protein